MMMLCEPKGKFKKNVLQRIKESNLLMKSLSYQDGQHIPLREIHYILKVETCSQRVGSLFPSVASLIKLGLVYLQRDK